MSKRVFLLIWFFCFVLLLANFLIPAYSTSVAYRSMFLVFNEDSVEVIPSGEFFRRSLDSGSVVKADAFVKYEPSRVRGPVRWLLELWTTESIFVDDGCIRPRQGPLTQEQVDRAYLAILEYANADPMMARYRPGQPPQTQFSFVLFGQSLLRIVVLFGVPTIVAFVLKLYFDKMTFERHLERRVAGVCIWCQYPCAEISSLRCPECGKFHTVPSEMAIKPDDQSSA